jgi:hypothetical protein
MRLGLLIDLRGIQHGHKLRDCGLLGARIANCQGFTPAFDRVHCSGRSQSRRG